MQRRSQENDRLMESHLEISTEEYNNRRRTNHKPTQSIGGCRLDDAHITTPRKFWKTTESTGVVIPKLFEDMEVKRGLIKAVQGQKFYGHPGSDPVDHLNMLNELCSIYSTNNIPPDVIRMMMFRKSLAEDAAKWEQSTSSTLLSSWDDVKKEFLNAFFPKEKAMKLRNFIITFRQRNNESFTQAWDRMKRYARVYPHHGFSKKHLLKIFYQGCDDTYQVYLDTAYKGDFMNADEKEGEQIISNLAKNEAGDDYEDLKLGETGAERMLDTFAELKKKLGLIPKNPYAREVNYISESNRTSDHQKDLDDGANEILRKFIYESFNEPDKSTNRVQPIRSEYPQFYSNEGCFKRAPYIGAKGFYISKNVTQRNPSEDEKNDIPEDHSLDELIENMIKKRNESATATREVVNTLQRGTGKRNRMGSNENSHYSTKPEAQSRKYERHSSSSPNRRSIQKKKLRVTKRADFCQFIEDENDPPFIEEDELLLDSNTEREFKLSSNTAINHERRIETLEGTLNRRMDIWDKRLDEVTLAVTTIKNNIVKIATSERPAESRIFQRRPEQSPKDFSQFLGSERESTWNLEPQEESPTYETEEDPYEGGVYSTDEPPFEEPRLTTPPLHYALPQPFPKTLDKARTQARAYADVIRALNIMTPTRELEQMLVHDGAFSQNFHQMQEHKEWYEDKFHTLPIQINGHHDTRGDPEQIRYVLERLKESDQCDEVESRNTRILEEGDRSSPEDPKCFTLPCFVNGTAFKKCVLDLGASKSIMPLDIAKAIGITEFEKTETSLVLADWTSRKTTGLARRVPITFERHTVSTDFLILDTTRAGPGRIILGRPFLEECNANFDARHGIVSFEFADNCRCSIYRDWDINEYGGHHNVSITRFFQQLALETRKRAACLGGLTDLREKHRIVELVEEYESSKLYTPVQAGIKRGNRKNDVSIPGRGTEESRAGRGGSHNSGRNRNSNQNLLTSSSPFEIKNIINGPRGGRTTRRGVKIFEWRPKGKEKKSPKNNDEASGSGNTEPTEEAPPPLEEQPPKEVAIAVIPEGDEVEPGDTVNQTQEDPPTS